MKLSQLLANNNVVSSGFPAIAGLGDNSNTKASSTTVLSSLPASVLANQGITDYYTLVLPRGTQFNTTEDIITADPDVKHWSIQLVDTEGLPTVITTQHQATLDLLHDQYPHAEVLVQRNGDGSPRNLSASDVVGKHVIGVLPPFLVAEAAAFTSVSIDNYNAARDGDLSGDQLADRVRIADKAITVREMACND